MTCKNSASARLCVCVTQASPTCLPNRTCRAEPSRAALSTTPLLWSHQNRRSSVKSMARPLGDSRSVLAMTMRSSPSKEALSTLGWTPTSVQNSFLKSGRRTSWTQKLRSETAARTEATTNFAEGWTAIPLGFSNPWLRIVCLFRPAKLLHSTVDWLVRE